MEDENLMSIFDSGSELNFGGFEDQSEEITDENDIVENDPIEDEVPEKVDGGEEDDDNEENDPDNESSPQLYSSIADVLKEQGLIPSLESSENIKTVDDLVNVFKNEINTQTNLRLQEYLDNLDLEKIATSKKTQLDLESVTEEYLKENLDVAKQMLFQDLVNQGLSEDRARKMLKKTIDLGEDLVIEEALEAKDSLKEFEKRIQDREQVRYKESVIALQKEQQETDNQIKDYIYNSSEIVKGIPNTKILQEKVFKSMTEIVSKNPNSGEFENRLMKERSENPIKFDTKMYYFYELTNGFTDLGSFKTTVNSKASKTLEKVLRQTKFEDNGTPDFMQDPNSYKSNFGSELVF